MGMHEYDAIAEESIRLLYHAQNIDHRSLFKSLYDLEACYATGFTRFRVMDLPTRWQWKIIRNTRNSRWHWKPFSRRNASTPVATRRPNGIAEKSPSLLLGKALSLLQSGV